ncbi:MAG: hypothetical protein J6S85_03910 [Methanobrevibacter sp.]|nr:hypothetical protein [Methanobrevibacter sp.]MBO7712688.1 hypothetical protein [Methanobrevibacter sp.]
MSAVERFKEDKSSFIVCVCICATIWFLAVCALFGIYIWRSFESGNIIATQMQEGDYNKQGVAGNDVSIN